MRTEAEIRERLRIKQAAISEGDEQNVSAIFSTIDILHIQAKLFEWVLESPEPAQPFVSEDKRSGKVQLCTTTKPFINTHSP